MAKQFLNRRLPIRSRVHLNHDPDTRTVVGEFERGVIQSIADVAARGREAPLLKKMNAAEDFK